MISNTIMSSSYVPSKLTLNLKNFPTFWTLKLSLFTVDRDDGNTMILLIPLEVIHVWGRELLQTPATQLMLFFITAPYTATPLLAAQLMWEVNWSCRNSLGSWGELKFLKVTLHAAFKAKMSRTAEGWMKMSNQKQQGSLVSVLGRAATLGYHLTPCNSGGCQDTGVLSQSCARKN